MGANILNEEIRDGRKFVSNSYHSKIAYKTNLTQPFLAYLALTQPRLA